MQFEQEHPLLLAFWRLCLLRQSPADFPTSVFLLSGLILINFLIGVTSFLVEHDLLTAILQTATDQLITLGLASMMLAVTLRTARILQTLIAISGASMILNLFSMPLLFLLPEAGGEQNMVTMLLTFIFIWHVFILGGIFRYAFELSQPAGILLSMVYIMLALMLFYAFFPPVIPS